MTITLYHYTDKESADNIDDSKIMYKSTDTIADAIWGIGVYFTDMNPDDFTADEIAYNNWLQTLPSEIEEKLEYCIEVEFPDEDIENCSEDNRRIILYPGENVDLELYPHKVFRTNF